MHTTIYREGEGGSQTSYEIGSFSESSSIRNVPESVDYGFPSSLPAALVKLLAPALQPLIAAPVTGTESAAA